MSFYAYVVRWRSDSGRFGTNRRVYYNCDTLSTPDPSSEKRSYMRPIYWTTCCLEPEIEAISKEVFELQAHFGGYVVAMNPNLRAQLSIRRRVLGLNPAFYPALRATIPVMEKFADISHVYGEPSPWLYHKTLRSRPLVLTVASEKGDINPQFVARCAKIIVQSASFKERLLSAGVSPDRVEVIYPGIDLSQFNPATTLCRDLSSPRVLFATAPRTREELQGRGVPLLIDAARLQPQARFHLLFRPWKSGYTSLEPTRQLLNQHDLANVTLTNEQANMADVYAAFDFTVAPFTSSDGGKECPNSVVEGLACGLPVLISSVVPFSTFVIEHDCGIVFKPDAKDLTLAIDKASQRYETLSRNARNAAEAHFSVSNNLAKIGRIYAEVGAQ